MSRLETLWQERIWPEASAILRSPTAYQSVVVFAGHLATAGLGFAAVLVVSRTLGPTQFGVFSTALAVLTLTAGLADLGLNTSLVRFASLYLETNPHRAALMFRVALEIRLLVSILILAAGSLLARPLAMLIFHRSEAVTYLALALAGAVVTLFVNYILYALQAYQLFIRLSAWMVAMNIVKLGLVAGLLVIGYLFPLAALAAYVAAPLTGALAGWWLLPRNFGRGQFGGERRECLGELLHFSKWVMVSYLATGIIGRINVLLLSAFRGNHEVGIYSAALQLAMVFPVLLGAIATVLLPKVSRMTDRQQLATLIKRSLMITGMAVLALMPAFFLSQPLIGLVFGQKYLASSGVFRILFLNFMISLLINPIGTVIYAIDRPQAAAAVNVLQAIISIAGNYLLIPSYGAYGAAYTYLALTVVGGGILVVYIWLKVSGSAGLATRGL